MIFSLSNILRCFTVEPDSVKEKHEKRPLVADDAETASFAALSPRCRGIPGQIPCSAGFVALHNGPDAGTRHRR
jgi:hypothetical protein